jgi:hypothetical protein
MATDKARAGTPQTNVFSIHRRHPLLLSAYPFYPIPLYPLSLYPLSLYPPFPSCLLSPNMPPFQAADKNDRAFTLNP